MYCSVRMIYYLGLSYFTSLHLYSSVGVSLSIELSCICRDPRSCGHHRKTCIDELKTSCRAPLLYFTWLQIQNFRYEDGP